MPDQKVIQALPVIIQRLHATYPDARYELNYETPLQLLVATILAAQCADERVNQETPALFAKYKSARDYAEADVQALTADLARISFNRQKALAIQGMARVLHEKHNGEVPQAMGAMVELPGVGRKTANVVLTNAYKLPTGVIVDTHVARVSQRLGLSDQTKPEKIETDLMKLVPKEEWIFIGPAVVLLGRYTCKANAPNCSGCILNDLCPKLGVGESAGDTADKAAAKPEEVPANMAAKKKTPAKAGKNGKAAATKAKPAATKSAPEAAPAPSEPSLRDFIPADWRNVLAAELDKPYFKGLEKFVAAERAAQTVYPPETEVFAAFAATPFEQVKVLLLGQDPYHGAGEAHGMCFSVKPGVKVPPSLVNIYKELQDDVGCKPPAHGTLTAWAQQGVMLLNSVLTVRANEAASHKEQGWETFTDAVIAAINARAKPAVFLLWGAYAKKKAALIDARKHRVLVAGHPSPLSSKTFFGSKPFSQANAALQELGQGPVNWQLPETARDPAAGALVAALVEARAAATAPKPNPALAPAPAPAPAAAPVPATPEGPTHLESLLPPDWREALADVVRTPGFRNLDKYLAGERKDTIVCPTDEADVFAALRLTPLKSVRVVLLGTEPPCFESVADGLAFSAREGADLSDAQKVMHKELRRDLGLRLATTPSLEDWARHGVLLLNGILTVRQGRPESHKNKGWEAFTDAILRRLSAEPTPIVFALWGNAAQKKRSLLDESRHVIVTGEHPALTPDKFLGSGVFSAINTALELNGRPAVYWQLPYV